jgi:hypothetical protein
MIPSLSYATNQHAGQGSMELGSAHQAEARTSFVLPGTPPISRQTTAALRG